MRLLPMTPLAFAFSCAPPPSTAPLGGEEWVKPERHADRRPRGTPPGQAEPPAVRAARAAPPPPAPPTRAPAPPDPVAGPSGPVRFELKPWTVGTIANLDRRFALNATLSTNLAGVDGSQGIEVEIVDRVRARVTSARGDQVESLELEYLESKSTFKMAGVPSDEDQSSGKRFRVTLSGGAPRVEALSGTLEPDAEKQVAFDLATITGYQAPVRAYLPATLAPAWSAQIAPSQLSAVFGALPSIRFENGSLRFVGRDPQNAARAEFECALSVMLDRDGMTFATNLSGKCVVHPGDTRPLEVNLAGDLRAENSSTPGADLRVAGRAEFRLRQSYGP